jgi:glyceraldehyde-3-phosphate dehydrogenase (NADP+)
MIPIQMELGGKDVCLVLEDADLELAATHIIRAASPTGGAWHPAR